MRKAQFCIVAVKREKEIARLSLKPNDLLQAN